MEIWKFAGRSLILVPILVLAVWLLAKVVEVARLIGNILNEGSLETVLAVASAGGIVTGVIAALAVTRALALGQLLTSIIEAANGCWEYILGRESYWSASKALVRPSAALAGLLLSGGIVYRVITNPVDCSECVADCPECVTPPPVEQVLLPETLRIHFDNAGLNERRDGLSGKGVQVDPERTASLDAINATLAHCVDAETGSIDVTVHGFASDDNFDGLNKEKSEDFNLKAANHRAAAVHKALVDKVSNVTVRRAKVLETYGEMIAKRDEMILVKDGTQRDPFGDRVVLLQLSGDTAGKCRVMQ